MRANSSHRSTSRRKTTDSSHVLALAFPWFSSLVFSSFLPLFYFRFLSDHALLRISGTWSSAIVVSLPGYIYVLTIMYVYIHMYTHTRVRARVCTNFTYLPICYTVTSGNRYRKPLICYEMERVLLLHPPTKPPSPSSLPSFCFRERVVSLPTDTRRIIRTASSLEWRFADCRFFLPFLASSFVFFVDCFTLYLVARVSYNIATGKRERDKR